MKNKPRRFLIAGNWKMNLDRAGAETLARDVLSRCGSQSVVDVSVFPPTIHLQSVAKVLAGSSIGLGAQNMYHESNGAFTGETSAAMLLDAGCSAVILGHSERRALMKEIDQDVNVRLHAALRAGLVPVVCLGETLEQREQGKTGAVIDAQFRGSLAGIPAEAITRVVIAYEPVWAIGTGKVATGDQAQEIHADLRKMLEFSYNPELARQVRILYGGSVKPDNASDLLARPDIDGALVGGASLQAAGFAGIVNEAVSLC